MGNNLVMQKPICSLRNKILAITIGVTCVTMLAMVLIVTFFVKPRLESKLEKRGISIAHAISWQCISPLLSRHNFQLDLLFREFIRNEKGVDYIYIKATNGDVAAHSFGREFPVDLKQLQPHLVNDGYGISRFTTKDHGIIEISWPLLEGHLGTLHVGMSAAIISEDVNEILGSFIGIAALLFTSSILLLFFLEKWIITPIFQIRSVSVKVKSGDIAHRVAVHSRDEIGGLAEDFNHMLDAINESREAILWEKQLLEESEQKLRTIIRQSPISMAMVSQDGTIEYINEYAIRTFGYQPEDIPTLREWWLKAYPDAVYREQVMARWSSLIKKAAAENLYIDRQEYDVTCKDGSIKTMLIFGVLLDDKVFIVFEDVTARKQVENKIQTLNHELERVVADRTNELVRTNRDLASFCYAISHELRAPVARLMGLSEVLLEDWNENPDNARYCVRRIGVASKELQRVINSVLQLSRLSQTSFAPQPLNLSQMAREIAGSLASEHPERKVEFVIADQINTCGDPALTYLCLENLLGNAFKYTSARQLARIEFGLDNTQQAFFVRDNGIGFDMTYGAKLFEPFIRLHKEDEYAGSGIGLATVHRIIERHGGRIWAEASPGQGATFYFTLQSVAGDKDETKIGTTG